MYTIQLSTGWIRKDYVTGLTEQEAIDFCDENGWKFRDENGFVWDMDYIEEYPADLGYEAYEY